MVAAGCGSQSAGADPVSHVVVDFTAAVARGDGAIACRLLTPETAAEVSQSEGSPCAKAIVQEQLPSPEAWRSVKRYGGSAQVVSTNDVAFLARFPSGWKIVAIGCTPRSSRPYDCIVKNG
jgi:hypothetical protein